LARPAVTVLGIDTSLRSTGYGVVCSENNRCRALTHGRIINPPALRHSACLDHIYSTISKLLAEFRPQYAAVEGIFFCKNVKTAVILGQARGAVLAACAGATTPVFEYSPRRVKQSVSGTGTAQKDQVGRMVMSIMGLPSVPQSDEADALAIALCHIHSVSGIGAETSGEI